MNYKQFHPNVKLRIAMSFFTNTLSNMVVPFMAVYFAKTLGTNAAGAASAFSILVGIFFATWGGYFADRVGRKKLMLLSEISCAAIYMIMALGNSPWWHSPWLTLVMMALVSACWGISKPAVEAMLIDVTTPDTRKLMYRITYWTNNLSISIAGIIGAFLFSDYLFELLMAVAVMTFVSFCITLFFIEETYMPGKMKSAEPKGTGSRLFIAYKEVLRDRTFMIYIAASILIVSVEVNLTNYIGIRLVNDMHGAQWLPWLHSQVNGIEMLGFLRTENTLLVVLLSLVIGFIVKNKNEFRVLFGGLILNVFGYSYMAFGNQPMALVLAMVLATWGELIYVPIKQSFLANRVPDHARSAYMAVNGFSYRGSMLLCSLNVIIGGFLPSFGMSLFILGTGILGIILMYVIYPKPETVSGSNPTGAHISA